MERAKQKRTKNKRAYAIFIQSSMSSLKLLFIKPFLLLATITVVVGQPYSSVFSFGDSHADTGNIRFINQSFHCLFPPYGETYFRRPTGRCSDGRLVIDFIGTLPCNKISSNLLYLPSSDIYIYLDHLDCFFSLMVSRISWTAIYGYSRTLGLRMGVLSQVLLKIRV